ncbi:MAG: anaerobic ribonucleoside-triphosphate reductase activating protein [Treponema sp.]|nr:anaerobic ribonucleoside-triphosphate reductase activating protein [Treponema sp.]
MRIVLKKTSFVDYPGKLCAVFFFPGCNLRCPWCQNSGLVTDALAGEIAEAVEFEECLAHLAKRRSILRGVVLSGGEPLIRQELPDIITMIKKNGLAVKLDTNGMNSQMLELLFHEKNTRPDYIALDLKLAPNRYSELAPPLANAPSNWGHRLTRSAELIRDSGIAHEYRTLSLPHGVFTDADIEALTPLVDESPWYFRPFRPGNCLEPSWNNYEQPGAETVKNHVRKALSLGKNAKAAALTPQ